MSTSKNRGLLKTSDVQKITGWSPLKVRGLIESGKLKAINTSTGKRPLWEILPESLEAFLNPNGSEPQQPESKRIVRKRIDANVAKVFGGAK